MLLKERIHREILPEMSKKYEIPVLGLPKVTKLTINVGIGQKSENKEMFETFKREIAQISGQKPRETLAKKSISGFKVRQGQVVGLIVSLRGNRMWDFTEKLVKVAFPRMRDFQGLEPRIIDRSGCFTIGLKEQLIFPEIKTDDVKEPWGMSLTYTLKNTKNMDAAKELLNKIGFIFKP